MELTQAKILPIQEEDLITLRERLKSFLPFSVSYVNQFFLESNLSMLLRVQCKAYFESIIWQRKSDKLLKIPEPLLYILVSHNTQKIFRGSF